MLEAGAIMTKNVLTVAADTPVLDAAKLLVERKVSGLPVVDEESRLVGILSEKDILKLLTNVDFQKCVRDYMTTDVICFEQSDSIEEICQFLIDNNIRRVPILTDGKLVGIVSRRDLIVEILCLKDAGQKNGS